ncbi:tyrosine-type recombinase/integrase [Streptomyces virginiae]|uniref:tyrosine-type recombinase/integrase n=1 Tax=Streptomyces virginiae TaxID=1961 RepID=UPI00378B39AE
MSKAQVYDRWHLSSQAAKTGITPCEHSTKTRTLYAAVCHGAGTRWQVRWRDFDGKQRKEHFDRRPDADRRAATIQADMARGSFADPLAGKETFRYVAERWQAGAIQKQSTAENAAGILRRYILPYFGDRQIATIRRSDVQTWVKELSSRLASSTLQITFGYLKTIFSTAVLDHVITLNPCEGVKLPTPRKPEIIPLREEIVSALIQSAPEHFKAMLLMAAASGLRNGELLGLEVEHIDFANGELHVVQQCLTPTVGVPYIATPKTHSSIRTVRVAKFAMDALKAHLDKYPPVPILMWDKTDARKPIERKVYLVFQNQDGRAVRRGQWSHRWALIVKRANKLLAESGSPHRVPEGASMHDFRHFYASLLIKHRESIKVVQKALGHAKPSLTLDTYVHLFEATEDTTRAAVEEGLAQVTRDLEVTHSLAA